MGLVVRTLIFIFSASSAHAQAIDGIGTDPACAQVYENQPPFFVVKPSGDSIPTKWDTNGAGVQGYLPKGAIVEVDSPNFSSVVHPLTELVGVHVLSVPNAASSQMESATVGGALASMGELQVVRTLGARGHVRAVDLMNISNPGSDALSLFSDSQKQVFYVRKNTPFFNMPQLQGRAVRLKQHGGFFALQKCCKPPTPPSLLQSWTGFETSRDRNCTYSPIFEVLKKDSSGNFVAQTEFARPAQGPNCTSGLLSALSPVATGDLDSIMQGLYQSDMVSSNFVDRLNDAFHNAALAPRNACHTEGKRRTCRNGITQGAKGACRAGVREVLEQLNLVDPRTSRGGPYRGRDGKMHTMSDHAEDYGPYLESQGFQDFTGRFTSQSAPIGCVVIYSGGGAGHIEMRTDQNTWCSDYCTDHPRDTSPTRTLKSVMCPPPDKVR